MSKIVGLLESEMSTIFTPALSVATYILLLASSKAKALAVPFKSTEPTIDLLFRFTICKPLSLSAI